MVFAVLRPTEGFKDQRRQSVERFPTPRVGIEDQVSRLWTHGKMGNWLATPSAPMSIFIDLSSFGGFGKARVINRLLVNVRHFQIVDLYLLLELNQVPNGFISYLFH